MQGSEVWLNYRVSGGRRTFEKVHLEPVFAGIYLWHIRLIGGEQLEYYISEKSERMENITESHLVELPVYQNIPVNRHARLSQMIETIQEGDGKQVKDQMWKYQAFESV